MRSVPCPGTCRFRLSRGWGGATLLIFSLVLGGCGRPVTPSSPLPAPSLPSAEEFSSEGALVSFVSGTGIVSHEHEVSEITPRMSRVISVPVPDHAVSVGGADSARSHGRHIRVPAAVAARRSNVAAGPLPPVRSCVFPPRRAGRAVEERREPASPRPAPAEWRKLAREAAEIFGLDAALVLAVIRVESAFDHAAESPAGAQGAMQVMPATQEELGLLDPFDPRANVYAGAQYLMHLIHSFGSVELALAAYNAGPASVERYGGIPPFPETREFVRRVTLYWEAEKNPGREDR